MTDETRDSQRQKVYDAEHTLTAVLKTASDAEVRTFDFYGSTLVLPDERKFGTLEGVQSYVDAVLRLNWVKATWQAARRPVRVVPSKTHSWAKYRALDATIRIPEHKGSHLSWAMREVVVLHELSHHLTPTVAAHGPAFAGTHIKLLSELIGPEVGLILTDALTQNGAKISTDFS